MRRLKKTFKWIVVILVLLNCVLLAAGKFYWWKALVYNYVNIDDYTIFQNRTVKVGSQQPWKFSTQYNQKSLTPQLEQQLEQYRSVAFLVVKDDSILLEKYWEGYSDSSLSSSFSMAKSIVNILIGAALKDGKIKSLDEPAGNYIPEFAESEKSKITIRHLLMMSSGLDWDEGYASLFSPVTEAYYGTDLYKLVTSLQVKEPPGVYWEYKSCDTQLLGFILEKATGKSLSEYCSEKIWTPCGALHDALWSLDHKNGHEKAYSAFSSNARDFARIGKLYLHKGNAGGLQVVDTSFVDQSTVANPLTDKQTGKPNEVYGYQWWVMHCQNQEVFYARGILGQYIMVIPGMNIIIVRLGHQRSTNEHGEVTDYRIFAEEVIKMLS